MAGAGGTIAARLARGVLALSLGVGVPAVAHAGDTPNAEANGHFENGVAAFHEKRFAEAVDEFAWAYSVAPAFQVLYNIGQVSAALQRNADAMRAFSGYIDDGGAAIPPSRRAEVEAEMVRLRALVGAVRVAISPEAAVTTIDGAVIPFRLSERPIFVEPGRHTVSAALSGYSTESRELSVGAGNEVAVELLLQPAGAAPDALPTMVPAPQHPVVTPTAPRAPAPSSLSRRGHPQRTAAYVVGAGGVSLMLAGTWLALAGAHTANTARERLAQASTGSSWDGAKLDYDDGAKQNDLGWGLAAVGTAAAAAGVLLYATAPSAQGSSLQVGIAALPSPLMNRVTVAGSW